jgi:8-oxo-dGTP diphosphatase
MTMAAPIQVAAAVIDSGDLYLITRRKAGTHLAGLWEFPGGKCEEGESLKDCLRREVREELGIEITDPVPFQTVRHDYPEKSVELHFFRCTIKAGTAQVLGCDDLKWVTAKELATFEFPPADRTLVKALQGGLLL